MSPVAASRRTSTSSVSKRNSAGRRTAWLPPLLNSLALGMDWPLVDIVKRLLRRLLEISEIRRRLVFPGGHQVAVGAEEIVVLAELDVLVVLDTDLFAPDR